MFDVSNEIAERLMEERIPVDDYARVMLLADNLNIEIDETEDPAEDFKQAVIKLNEAEELPSYLADYCTKYEIGHELPEIELPEKDIFF